jgi:hypothetical protein
MKLLCLPLLVVLLLAACNGSAPAGSEAGATPWQPPAAGTTVASDSMKVDDPLNNFYFAVKLTVSPENEHANGDYGFVYDVTTHYGPGAMTGTINMPPGGRSLKPLLRKAPEGGYKYIVGFIAGKDMGGDGQTFQELYAIEGSRETIAIKPLKSYRFR